MGEHSYRLATFLGPGGQPRAGLVVDDSIIDLAGALTASQAPPHEGSFTAVLDVLRHWHDLQPSLRDIARNARVNGVAYDRVPLSRVKLLAPVLYPGTIFCAGANYRDHVAEMSKALNLPAEPDPHEAGLKPWHFIKPSAACVRGTAAAIALPAYSKKVDWEAEIALVIGRECRNVSVARALDYVAGLTIANDLSARDHLRREGVAADSPFRFDWVSQKSFDGALPLGPWIVPIEDITDPANLGIKLWVNDELMQDSSSSNLIFSMAEQIAHLSSRLTLRPGDLIVTGTPAGCGAARGRFLKAGDRVRVWVEGIGELSNDFTG
jgi:2-keto-4-pentenoate hydratase/2-oxohepta-3-ene-1,7-dioic acid hydratase in catechol pathway